MQCDADSSAFGSFLFLRKVKSSIFSYRSSINGPSGSAVKYVEKNEFQRTSHGGFYIAGWGEVPGEEASVTTEVEATAPAPTLSGLSCCFYLIIW